MDSLACCSALRLISKEGNPYLFRTCDYKNNIWDDGAHIVSFPAGGKIEFYGGNSTVNASYTVLGVTDNSMDTWLLDGINSEGLTGCLLKFDEGTGKDKPDRGFEGVMGMEMVTFILSTCKTVDDVIKKSSEIQVLNVPTGEGKTVSPSMHYMFTDISGKSVVLEADDLSNHGILKAYQENIGIMTNSPSYDRQMNNLSWFISQSDELRFAGGGKCIDKLEFEDMTVAGNDSSPHLCKNGTFPGSYASYDRFVRLAVLKALNDCGRNFSDDCILPRGAGIIYSVFEPKNRSVFHYFDFDENGEPMKRSDGYTQYIVMYDIKNKCLYINPYDSTAWTNVCVSHCSVDEKELHQVCRNPFGGVVNSSELKTD